RRAKSRTGKLASAALSDPTQIFGQALADLDVDDLRELVWMKRAQFILKCLLSIFRGLEKDDHFAGGFDLFLPAIDRVNSRNDVSTGRELFGNQRVRDTIRSLQIRKRADRE